MMNLFVAALAFAVCIAATPAFSQHKPLSALETAKIKAEIAKAGDDYLLAFSKEDWKGVAESVYSHPAISIGPMGVEAIDTAKSMGWVKSAFFNPTICVLNANTALLSGKFRRYDKDNKVIFEAAEMALFGKAPDGWKIVGLFAHPVDQVVSCKD
jgi:hypothetical protein